MDPKRAARQKVTVLVKRFFEDLTSRLAAGTADLWHRVEQRLPHRSNPAEPDVIAPPGALRTPMQQQPVQQQQSKAEEDK